MGTQAAALATALDESRCAAHGSSGRCRRAGWQGCPLHHLHAAHAGTAMCGAVR